MTMFLFGILVITFLGFTRSESCVSESSFNELKEEMRLQFGELKSENRELKEKLMVLESKLNFYESRREKFSANKISDAETETLANTRVSDISNRINRDIVSKIELGKLKRQESTNVAFYAYLSGDRCYGSHETFIFDAEVTNVGNGYSARDGIFGAPVTGVYMFTVTLVPYYAKKIQAEVIVNGAMKGNIVADSDASNNPHPASASIVVHVNAGDRVYIRRGVDSYSGCNVISDIAHARSTFAGWLLF